MATLGRSRTRSVSTRLKASEHSGPSEVTSCATKWPCLLAWCNNRRRPLDSKRKLSDDMRSKLRRSTIFMRNKLGLRIQVRNLPLCLLCGQAWRAQRWRRPCRCTLWTDSDASAVAHGSAGGAVASYRESRLLQEVQLANLQWRDRWPTSSQVMGRQDRKAIWGPLDTGLGQGLLGGPLLGLNGPQVLEIG